MDKNPGYYRALLASGAPHFLVQVTAGYQDWIMYQHQQSVRQTRRTRYEIAREGYEKNRSAYDRNRRLMLGIIQEFNRIADRLETQTLMPKRGFTMPAGFRAMTRSSFRDAAAESTAKNAEIDGLLQACPTAFAPLPQLIKIIDSIADHMHMANEAQDILRSFHAKFTLVPLNRWNRA